MYLSFSEPILRGIRPSLLRAYSALDELSMDALALDTVASSPAKVIATAPITPT